jgi:hypothetical protein
MAKNYRIQILLKTEDFPDLSRFLNNTAKIGFRENNINTILDIEEKITFYEMDKPLFGTTYQSKWRDITDLRNVSHSITSIEIHDNNIYANISILSTPSGNSIGFINETFIGNLILKPVYKGIGLILTFDLDFQQINNAT